MKKTLIVTGASFGIGEQCITLASKLGLNVIAIARSKTKLSQLQEKLTNVQVIVADISSEQDCERIVTEVKGDINYILYNAAYLQLPESLSDMTRDEFQKNISTNVEPILFLTQKLVPQLHKVNNPRILSISSGAAIKAIAGIGNYCISKAAAYMATNYLNAELGKQGILVNNYFPGVVDTAMQKTLRSSNSTIFPFSGEFKKLKKTKSLNLPKEVAEHILACFLKLTDAEFMQDELTFKKKAE